MQICKSLSYAFALSLQRALLDLDSSNLTAQAVLLRAGCALGHFHQLLKLDALFRFLAAYFLGALLQTGFVLLKRDPDGQIAANNLAAKGGLARAGLVVFRRRRNRHCKAYGADDRTEFRSRMRWPRHGSVLPRRFYNLLEQCCTYSNVVEA